MHFTTSTLTLILIVLAIPFCSSTKAVRRRVVRPSSNALAASAPTVLPDAQHVLPLVGRTKRSARKKTARAAIMGAPDSRTLATSLVPTGVLAGSDSDGEYLINATVGGQNFALIVDTGSSDTWVVEQGFSCYDLDWTSVNASTCAFGPSFNSTRSKTFKPYPNHVFDIEYVDLEHVNGTVAFETVSAGGLNVTSQEIGIVQHAAWVGDGVNSGLMGLAYPALTCVYNVTDPAQANANTRAPYNPFFFTAVAEGKVQNPYFSVALNRGTYEAQEDSVYDPNLGYIAFGGIAPVKVTNQTVTVPVQGYAVDSNSSMTNSTYFFYTVDVQSYDFPGSSKLSTANNNTILDSGSTLNYVPNPIAKAYNAKFEPAATYVEDEDMYHVDCQAKVPLFGVTIGGVSFSIDIRDQIVPFTDDEGRVFCVSGTQNGGEAADNGTFVLGDVFLHNVVSTFNIQTEQITLSQRASVSPSCCANSAVDESAVSFGFLAVLSFFLSLSLL